ncbi:hypothetical protein ABHI66_004756, partial [Salmonella enterica subsp. enterica serovar Newport]
DSMSDKPISSVVEPSLQGHGAPIPDEWRGEACRVFDEEMAKSTGDIEYSKAQELASALRQYEEMSFEPSEREMNILELRKADIAEAKQWIQENVLQNPVVKQRMYETVRDYGRNTGIPEEDAARQAYLNEMSAITAAEPEESAPAASAPAAV